MLFFNIGKFHTEENMKKSKIKKKYKFSKRKNGVFK
jgi:hypothetical protein